MTGADTKTTILDAAEGLFAEHGYDGTSLRSVTARAKVNLAAVNYHFGGKERLAIEVLVRHVGPINAERHRRLDALPTRPTMAAIVRAFVEPVFPVRAGCPAGPAAPGRDFCRMFGRMMAEQPPFLRAFLAGQFRELGHRFVACVRSTRTGIDPATAWWRLHFMAGAMAHTLLAGDGIAHLTEGLCDPDDAETTVEQLVAFVAAGLAGPPTPSRGRAARPARTQKRRSRR